MGKIIQTVDSLSSELCCGCALCMDICPVNAISMGDDEYGNRRPFVCKESCILCGKCSKNCPQFNHPVYKKKEKNAYIGFSNLKEIAQLSSSGGIFSVLAKHIIEDLGGIVYGAAMNYQIDSLQCKHIRIDNIKDLPLIQGSKYVQSRTDGIFKRVYDDLKTGRIVLFSGTSCQVASLKRYIGDNDLLYTVDLICHGVPKENVFRDYINLLENRYRCKITNISFRKKGLKYRGVYNSYVLSLSCSKADNTSFTKKLFVPESEFYTMFIHRAGYRESCYHCPYASIEKPADITLGDFIPSEDDYITYRLYRGLAYSSIVVNTDVGRNLLSDLSNEINCTLIPIKEMVLHHDNLATPSVPTKQGLRLYKAYLNGGHNRVRMFMLFYWFVGIIKKKTRFIVSKLKRK